MREVEGVDSSSSSSSLTLLRLDVRDSGAIGSEVGVGSLLGGAMRPLPLSIRLTRFSLSDAALGLGEFVGSFLAVAGVLVRLEEVKGRGVKDSDMFRRAMAHVLNLIQCLAVLCHFSRYRLVEMRE